MESKRVGWLDATCCPFLPKNMAKTSGYIVMTDWQLSKKRIHTTKRTSELQFLSFRKETKEEDLELDHINII